MAQFNETNYPPTSPTSVSVREALGVGLTNTPEQYGAQPNVPSFDSYPAFASMLAAITAAGGGVVSLDGSATYYVSQTIYVDPTLVTFLGNGASLNWSFKAFADPASGVNLVTNGNFASGANWTNGISDVDSWIITGGQLTHDNGWSGSGTIVGSALTENSTTSGTLKIGMVIAYAGSPSSGLLIVSGSNPNWVLSGTPGNIGPVNMTAAGFGQIGQQLATVAGQKLRFTVNVAYIQSVTNGINTNDYITFGIYGSGVGNGTNRGTLVTIKMTDQQYSPSKTYTWDIICPDTNGYLTIQTTNGVAINTVEVQLLPDNFMLYVTTPATGLTVGFQQREIADLFLIGDATNPTWPIEVTIDSPAPASANIRMSPNFRNINGRYVGIGWYLGSNCFLVNVEGGATNAKVRCIETSPGGYNAGENITFRNHTLGVAPTAIYNPGGYSIGTPDCSFDANGQFYDGADGWNGVGMWLEPQVSAMVYGAPLINVSKGVVNIKPRIIQPDGSTTPVLDTPFVVGVNGTLIIETNNAFNLNGIQDCLSAGGPITALSSTGTSGTAAIAVTGASTGVLPGWNVYGVGIAPETTVLTNDGAGNLTVSNNLLANLSSTTINYQPPGGVFSFKMYEGSNVEQIAQRDVQTNLYGVGGDIEGSQIILKAWLASSANHLQADPLNLYYIATPTVTTTLGLATNPLSRQLVLAYNGATNLTGADAFIHNYLPAGGNPIILQSSVTASSTTTSISGTALTIGGTTTGSIAAGMQVSGSGITNPCTIVSGSGTSWVVSTSQSVSGISVNYGSNTVDLVTRLGQTIPINTTVQVCGAAATSINSVNQLYVANDWSVTGVQSLGIVKGNYGSGTDLQVYIAVPIEKLRNVGGEFWWYVPGGGSGTANVFFNVYYARLVDMAGQPTPLIDGNLVTIYDSTYSTATGNAVNLVTGQPATREKWSSVTGIEVGLSPEWVTHALIQVGLESAPAGFTMRMDSFFAAPL